MDVFHHDISSFLKLAVDDEALTRLRWREVGRGLSLARLAQQGENLLLLLHIEAGADPRNFVPHLHNSLEVYLVLRGLIEDETGTYGPGQLVCMPAGSAHNPKASVDTLVLALLYESKDTTLPSRQAEFSPEQLKQFRDQGYFVTRALFDEQLLHDVRREFERLWQDAVARARKEGRSIPDMGQLDLRSPVCDAFCRHPAFLALCRHLLGPDANLIWNMAVIKSPSIGSNPIHWHQDQWYAINDPYSKTCDPALLHSNESSFTAWVAITRTTVENGTLWVLPGRHREGLLPHAWDPQLGDWQGGFDTSGALPVELSAGQVLVMSKYLPHSSRANLSQEMRMAYQISYGLPGLRPGPLPETLPLLRGGVSV
jgi:phytanoyl-CoA hydroxylase